MPPILSTAVILMHTAKASALLMAGLLVASCASSPGKPAAGTAANAAAAGTTAPGMAPAGAPQRAAQVPGYLPPGTIDMLQVMPPAPMAGDARDEADRRIFRETRAFKDTPRWKMASDDAQLGTAQMLQQFSCAIDLELTPQQVPKMVLLLQRTMRDATQAMADAKERYRRKRPYQVDSGEICRPAAETNGSYDYPSGHATAGWTWGLVLAQVAPERASPILARARSIGDSRVVCGVHNASAVSAARLLSGETVAVASAMREYQEDLTAARAELSALRAAPHAAPAPARCEAEAALIRLPVPSH